MSKGSGGGGGAGSARAGGGGGGTAAASSGASAAASKAAGKEGASALKAFNSLDKGHNQVLIADLRQKMGLSHEKFNSTINDMRRAGIFTASPVERHMGDRHERAVAGGLPGPSGPLVWISLR